MRSFLAFLTLTFLTTCYHLGHGQKPAWPIGNSYLKFPTAAQTTTDLAALPRPNDPNVNPSFQYQGQIPQFSQYVQLDDRGELLFFWVDGDIYDGKGYMIADGLPAGLGQYQLLPGINGVTVAPVPGRCHQWYIFHHRDDDGNGTQYDLQVVVLDMTLQNAPNALHPIPAAQRGRVLDANGSLAEGFDLINTWQPKGNYSVMLNDQNGSFIPEPPSGTQAGYFQMDAVHCDQNDRSFLVLNTWHHLVRYEILHNNVQYLGVVPISSIPPGSPQASTSLVRVKNELEACCVGGDLKVAFSARYLETPIAPGAPVADRRGIRYMRFLATHPTLPTLQDAFFELDIWNGPTSMPTNVNGTSLYQYEISGVEFTSDGNYVYWSKPSSATAPGMLGWIDLTNNFSLDLQTNIPQFVDAEIEINVGSDGVGGSLYITGKDAAGNHVMGELKGADDPLTAVWVPNSGYFANLTQSQHPGLSGDLYYLLMSQMHNDPTEANLLDVACCDKVFEMTAQAGYTSPSGYHTWTNTSNPFNLAEARLADDLVIPSGSFITANDLTFRFGPDASLIIQPGASFTCHDCLLTSACTDQRWLGAVVNGDGTDASQSTALQGRLTLFNSELSNAVTGAWTMKHDASGAVDPDGYGGIIRATGSTFRNNDRGVLIEHFHRFDGSNEVHNRSHLIDCDFITDTNWPDAPNFPNDHVRLSDVNGVRLANCSFRNDDHPSFTVDQRGWGLAAIDATFICDGYMNYTHNKFENLTLGAIVVAPDPGAVYQMNGMAFHNNAYYGLLDFQGSDQLIINNQFRMLSPDPLPVVGQSSVGLYLFASERYTVERNTFIGNASANAPTAGIWHRGPSIEDNRIYDNAFDGLRIATMAYGKQVDDSQGTPATRPGLQWLCGDYGETTANNWDMFVEQDATGIGNVRADQGESNPASAAANNRLFTQRNCGTSGSEIVVGNGIDPASLEVTYHYFDHQNNPEMRPECVHTPIPNFTSLSYMDAYYDLSPVGSSAPFDKEEDCTDGFLDGQGSGGNGHLGRRNSYQLRLQELAAAIDQYNGVVDGGEKPDLIELINYNEPWHPSHVLRDQMLAQAPLSDEVLLAAIWREQPMDPWHLSQVLINNSELTNEIWGALEESQVLSNFFLAMIDQYQGQQNPRAIYEDEIVLRHGQKTQLQHELILHYAQDTTSTWDVRDSIDIILAMDTFSLALRTRYWLACAEGDLSLATTLQTQLQGINGTEGLVDIGALLLRYPDGLTGLTPTDLSQLDALAFDEGAYAGAFAWGLLLGLGQSDSLPPALIPPDYRNFWVPKGKYRWDKENWLSAYPNPASDRVVLSYPPEAKGGVLEVFDPQGILVRSISLDHEEPFVQIATGEWAEGLYLGSLNFHGIKVGGTKFTIIR